jgi:2-methylcitrate dehydratase
VTIGEPLEAMPTTWAGRLASWLLQSYTDPIPDGVLERAAVHLFDTIACAAGGHGSRAVDATMGAIAGSGPPLSTLWFKDSNASPGDAVLVNGTAARFLDANDVFLGKGPGGHPSDNVPVAVAVAEASNASGRDLLAAIALSYELVARIRTLIFRPSLLGPDWHEVSISGPVSAAITALLSGANHDELTNAISIGAARGYSLKEIRRGQISSLKAAANAMVAREGVLAAHLALNGLTGPPEIFEGASGLIQTLQGERDPAVIERLCAPPEWVITKASIKPFPAFGTSQAAITAATSIAATGIAASQIENLIIRLPDTEWTRDYIQLKERRTPSTRETADHSLQFLVSVALIDGDVTQRQYEDERWLDEDVASLMAVTRVEADHGLTEHATRVFPASVIAQLEGGEVVERTVVKTPGSPENPWSWPDVTSKFARLDRSGIGEQRITAIAEAARNLNGAADVRTLTESLR